MKEPYKTYKKGESDSILALSLAGDAVRFRSKRNSIRRLLRCRRWHQKLKSTRVAKLLGIEYPIIQAPFGGFPSQQLTAAVSNLGGLGSLGAVTLSSSAITEVIEEIRSLTTKPFAINLWVSTSDRQAARIESDTIQRKIRGLAR